MGAGGDTNAPGVLVQDLLELGLEVDALAAPGGHPTYDMDPIARGRHIGEELVLGLHLCLDKSTRIVSASTTPQCRRPQPATPRSKMRLEGRARRVEQQVAVQPAGMRASVRARCEFAE
jgi:hypothetical protein